MWTAILGYCSVISSEVISTSNSKTGQKSHKTTIRGSVTIVICCDKIPSSKPYPPISSPPHAHSTSLHKLQHKIMLSNTVSLARLNKPALYFIKYSADQIIFLINDVAIINATFLSYKHFLPKLYCFFKIITTIYVVVFIVKINLIKYL
jgi:hypothetical protein